MARNLRCGLMGIGMMGRNHARLIREIPGVDLAVIADQNGDNHDVAQGVPFVSSVTEALKFELDCAIIAVPTKNHEAVALECASAKVASLIEKPLAATSESAKTIMGAFQATNTLGAVGHIERFNPAVIELSRRLQSGDLGEVYQIATRRQSSFPARVSDVGVVKDLATHDIDLVLSLSGFGYNSISAFTSHQSARETEDMVIVNATLTNGVIVSHVVNWLSPLKERVTVVTGESGIFVADTLRGDLTLHRNGKFDIDWESFSTFRGVSEGDVTTFAFSKQEPLKAELVAFFDAVRTSQLGRLPSLEKGLEVVAVAEAIMISSDTKAVVKL